MAFVKFQPIFVFVVSLSLGWSNSGCSFTGLLPRREIVERKHVSSLTASKDHIYFGAGYSLYRLEPSSKTLEEVYKTDRILVEQPLVDDKTVFFGGLSYTDPNGLHGEKEGLFAVDLESSKKIWKFELGVGGYGTFGTFPVFAGDDNVLVCARQHLHSLNRKTGKENWKIDNWFGHDADGITIPYVYGDFAYFKIAEEYFTKKDSNDGQWAKIDLATGERTTIFEVVGNPGKYHDQNGNGIGLESEGVLYGALRYNGADWPSSFFGALDLTSGRILWEVSVGAFRTRPAIGTNAVFTFDKTSVLALDRQNGKTRWTESLEKITPGDIDWSKQRLEWDYEHHYSRRLATDSRVLIVQGSRGVEARNPENGKLIWRNELVSQRGDSDPIVFNNLVIVSSVKDCSLLAYDLITGKLEWTANIPSCSYHMQLDD